MSNIPFDYSKGQVLLHHFDFDTCIRSTWIEWNFKFHKALKSDRPFDPSVVFKLINHLAVINGENKRFYFKADTANTNQPRIELTEQAIEYLPHLYRETLHEVFFTTPHTSQGLENIQEVKGVSIVYSILTEMRCTENKGKIYFWPADGHGEQFEIDAPQHPQPPATPKSKQIPKPEEYPPLHAVQDPKPKETFKEKKEEAVKDIQKHYPGLKPKTIERRAYNAHYAWTRSKDITKYKHYPWKEPHAGWYCSAGIKQIAKIARCSERTVMRYRKRWREANIMQCRYMGSPGKGNDINEMPKSWRHVKLWINNPKTQGFRKGKPKPGPKPRISAKGTESGA